MKNLFKVIFANCLIVGLFLSFQHARAHDHSSVHGMVLFGSERIYLSHLPLFHSPHDYQAIFEVTLDSQTLNAYRARLRAEPNALFTIAPEAFVLPDMARNPRPFRAGLFHGHFERNGAEIAANARITIARVLFFRKFDPSTVKPRVPKFFLIGNRSEQFLVHEIVSPPDFDQILRVELSPQSIPTFLQRDFLRVQVSDCAHYQPIANGLDVILEGENDLLLDAKLGLNIYLETEELRE